MTRAPENPLSNLASSADDRRPSVLFEMGLKALRQGDKTAALLRFRQIQKQAERNHDERLLAWALYHLGLVHRETRSHSEAIDAFDEARSIFIRLGHRVGEGLVTRELSNAHKELDRNTLALEYAHKSVEILESYGQPVDLAWAYENLSTIFFNLFRRHESLTFAKKARRLFLENDVDLGIAWNSSNLGFLYLDMGYYDEAEHHFSEARRRFTQAKNVHGEAWSRLGLGFVQRARCHFDAALQSLEKAAEKFEKLGFKDRTGWCLLHEGAIKRVQGLAEESLLLNKRALHLFSPLRHHDGVAWALFQLAQGFRDRGRLTKAWQTAREALNLHTDGGNTKGQGWDSLEIGKICLEMNDQVRAMESFIRAKGIAETLDESRLKSDVEKSLGRLHIDEGYFDQARTVLYRANIEAGKVAAREIQAEIRLQDVRLAILEGDLPQAKIFLKEVRNRIDEDGLERLRPLLAVCTGEWLALQGKLDEANSVFRDAILEAVRTHQKWPRLDALMGLLQLAWAKNQNANAAKILHALEKEVRPLNSRKVRAKLLLLQILNALRLRKTLDRDLLASLFQILFLCQLRTLKIQCLVSLQKSCAKEGLEREAAEFDRELHEALDDAGPDVQCLYQPDAPLGLLPVSVIS